VNGAINRRDRLIVCSSKEDKIKESLFLSSDIKNPSFIKVYSQSRREERKEREGQDENSNIPSVQCESEKYAYISLSLSLSHLIPSYESRIIVDKRVKTAEGIKRKNIIMRGK
jgi:hypothetical protein